MPVKLINTSHSFLKKPVSLVVYFAFFLTLLPVSFYAFKHPSYNWDMLAYMASVLKMDKKDFNEIHSIVYASAKESIPAPTYKRLTEGELRKKKLEDPESFKAIMPFYAVKPLYGWLCYVFYKAGASLPLCTVLPSVMGFLLTGVIAFHWLSRRFNAFFSFAVAVLIMHFPVFINMARLSSPDGLSAFFILSAFYFILEKPSIAASFLLLLLSVLTRLDNMVLSFLTVSFLFFSGKWVKRISVPRYIVLLTMMTGTYFLVAGIATNYDWGLLYYPTFARYYNPEYELRPAFSMSEYFVLFKTRVVMAILHTHFLFFILPVVLMFAKQVHLKFRNLSFEMHFSVLLVAIIVLRFILYPNLEDRFYIAYYLVFLILFINQFLYRNTASEKDV